MSYHLANKGIITKLLETFVKESNLDIQNLNIEFIRN
jgi:hypothetical protein